MSSQIKLEEVVAVVERLNDEWWEEPRRKMIPFNVMTDGTSMAVTFLDARLWCDEDDARSYNEEKDEYEPLDAFLRREVQVLGVLILEVFPLAQP